LILLLVDTARRQFDWQDGRDSTRPHRLWQDAAMADPETRGGVIVLASIVLGIVAARVVSKPLPNGRAETPGQSALCIGAFTVVVVGFCVIAL
jgi:hypothetical protein